MVVLSVACCGEGMVVSEVTEARVRGQGADLDNDEACTVAVGGFEVYIRLVMGDVEALDCACTVFEGCRGSSCTEQKAEEGNMEDLHLDSIGLGFTVEVMEVRWRVIGAG